VCESTTPQDPTPPRDLGQLKVSIRHILDHWTALLQRRHYLRALSQHEVLRDALADTYAAHVHNAVHAVLSFDLIRAIGALILDDDRRSASVARAVSSLRNEAIVRELRAEYGGIPVGADEATKSALRHLQRTEFDGYLASIPEKLREIEVSVLGTEIAEIIRTVRNKVVAHNDVTHDGADWKMWQVKETGLTYGQLDEYIDHCTQAVDQLSHLVLRHAFAFDDLPGVSERYVKDYIEALVLGLGQQKTVSEQRRAETLKRTQALFSEATAAPSSKSAP